MIRIFFASIFFIFNAQAQEVNFEKVKLLGRGILDRETRDVLALSCSDDCTVLQFLHFSKKHVSFVGEKMRMPKAPTDRLKEKAIELLVQEYMLTRSTSMIGRHSFQDNKKGKYIHYFALGLVGLMVVTPMVVVSPNLVALIIVGGGSVVSGTFLSDKTVDSFAHDVNLDVPLMNQDGWNWSEKARKISHSRFQSIVDAVSGPGGASPSYLNHIQLKKYELELDGVVF